MFCMIDNYDSFTYNLVHYVRETGADIEVFRNDCALDGIDFARFEGAILSPGPSSPENAGITCEVIRRYAELPMLGVCLGMQAMGHALGGRVVRAARIMHGKTDEITHRGGPLFRGIPERFNAVRYHSLAVAREGLPECFTVEAESSDGEIMALSHRERFLWGVQFHPESYLTEHGRTIIENFIGGCRDHAETHSKHN
ncbi:MAG: aminodeoxychorismate/anthranilate synthase component II [Spirochaetes bacterium]|nr:MAG: aminodeoxychorismate/anthranilate synthase component II [Spirochaetota bacterium]